MTRIMDSIQTLCAIPGVSGCEDQVRECILGMIKDHCASWHIDATGNLLAFKEGEMRPKNTLMLSAHMDEVGFIVTHIEDDGLLRFACVGGIDARVIIGKPVELGRERLPGVIGSKAVHMQTDREKEEVSSPDSLFIDIGASDKPEASQHVSPGDRAVFSSPFLSLGENYALGRALDDRAGCALLIELLRSDLPYDCHFAFTVQEETGCTGAVTAGYTIRPDIGIVVEATTAADIAGVSPDRTVCRLGKGPVISFMDKGTVYDRRLYNLAFDIAKRGNIRCQAKTLVAGANEARSVQTAGTGARMLAVSLPCRYLHSPSNVLNKEDIGETYRLLAALIGELGDYREQ